MRRVLACLVLFATLLGMARANTRLLVCAWTNEVLASCCCAAPSDPADDPAEPALAERCCCREVVIGGLPAAAPSERSDLAPPVAPTSFAAQLPLAIAEPFGQGPSRLLRRETGPPLAAAERRAVLQVFHL